MIAKIYKICLFALAGLLIQSCSDSFLDFDPVAAENSASFYLTMNHAELAVAAAYSTLSTRTAWDRDINFVMGDVTSNDAEAGGDFENEVPGTEDFNRFTFLPTSGALGDCYGVMFRGVHFCNTGLEKIPNILETDPNADPEIINIRLAELKFLRALNYMYLTNIFGQVPLADHILLPSEYDLDVAPIKDIYLLVEQDLKEAMAVLPEKSALSSQNIGRATKGAAKALLARMLIFESSYATNFPGDARFEGMTARWQEALDVCEDIRNSGEYSLVGSEGETYSTWRGPETNGYQYMFTIEGENCAESIFEIQYINDGLDYTLTRAGSLVQWTSARYYSNPDGTQGTTGYWGLGWPTQSLVDEYDADDARLHANVNMPGDSIQISGGVNHPTNFDNSGTGYYMKKYELSAEQFANAGGHGWQKSPANIKLLRYADVLLMASEAAIMLGNNAKALEYINMVRSRARNCGNGTVPADLTGTVTLAQLIAERRMELAFEGRRYFDMVRWNIARDLLNNTETPLGFPIVWESPKNDFMPIPQREITTSSGKITQHEGW
ncbi:MAG: RagB/SusD family nutrient uptake outer membrane protein [Bacteroidales bacterium]|nr:RagB/SusD family nutrient uptake outer membrane protein [Bacteroidales bacterium]MBN2821213.1 RagB/SusD family nutrient uptake outer membrane protein [Bacteroidales bacterium]